MNTGFMITTMKTNWNIVLGKSDKVSKEQDVSVFRQFGLFYIRIFFLRTPPPRL